MRQTTSIVGALALLTLAGCAASPSSKAEDITPLQEKFAHYSADYDLVDSPEELAELSQVLVVGEIVSITDGRILRASGVLADGGDIEDRRLTVGIRHTEVLRGTDLGEIVYVELPDPGNQGAATYRDVLPAGLEVAAYLDLAWEGSDYPWRFDDPKGGRPKGEPLFQPANAQGFIVEADGGDSVDWPLEGGDGEGASLEDVLPGGNLVAGD